MSIMSAIFESVADVWLIWAVTLFILTWGARRTFNQFQVRKMARFHRCESGATYALPYVITFTVFMIVMATFIQATLILMAKVGTLYAANNACRTYIVWQSAGQGASVAGIDIPYPEYKARRAATQAMVPFASSFEKHQGLTLAFPPKMELLSLAAHHGFSLADLDTFLSTFATGGLAVADREAYLVMYRNILENANAEAKGTETSDIIESPHQGSSDTYIRNKYIYAALATKVELPGELVEWNGDVEVKVSYRMPFMIPGTSRILAANRFPPVPGFLERWLGIRGVPYRDIETTVIMPAEAAKTEDGKVGIPYQPSLFVDLLN